MGWGLPIENPLVQAVEDIRIETHPAQNRGGRHSLNGRRHGPVWRPRQRRPSTGASAAREGMGCNGRSSG
jgi:hypothetical protein